MQNYKWYIYEIECNGYHYIGQHKYYNNNIDDKYITSGTIIRRLIKKYHFTKTILIDNINTQEQANELEIEQIKLSREKYAEYNVNILGGGQGTHLGAPLSEETKKKISKTLKRKLVGDKNPFYGRKHTLGSKQKIAKAGKKNIGKHWYTDGKIEIFDFNCPDGFVEGRLKSSNKNIGKRWYTDGADNYFGLECPYGYRQGFTISEIKKEAIRKRNSANVKYERTNELINDALTLNCASFSKKYNCSRSTYKRIRKEIKGPEQ